MGLSGGSLQICSDDNSFGPTIRGCRNDFDFTLRFEHIILSILPSVCLLISSPFRILQLARARALVRGEILQFAKLITITIYTIIQLVVLILVSRISLFAHNTAIASAATTFLTGFSIAGLSYFEHSKSLRPSLLLTSYLLLTILLDAAQSRTLLTISPSWPLGRLQTAAIGFKAIILLLECIPKRQWEISRPKQRSPEITLGIFSIATFAWLRQLFVLGNRKLLDVDDLPMLDETMTPGKLDAEFWNEWIKPSRHGRGVRITLAVLRALGWRFFTPIPARLVKIGFDFCQPLLINRVQTFLLTPNSPAREGKALIGATVFTYSGIAVSMAVYRYYHFRNVAVVRGFLVSGIFRKTTVLKLGSDDNKASLTLMSTDVERCRLSFYMIHEIWANVIEFALAAWLLERQIGIAFLVPVGIVLLCFIGSLLVGKFAPKYNRAWVAATQRRVGSTANVIANMKSLKISGLAVQLGSLIQSLREKEIKAGLAYRVTLVFGTLCGFGPSIVSPVLMFVTTNRTVNSSKAFTSLSYLALLTQPLTGLFQIIPTLIASYTCLDRIAAYLAAGSWSDYRVFESDAISASEEESLSLELSEKDLRCVPHQHNANGSNFAFIIRKGSFGWSPARFALRDIDLTIPTGQLTMVIGPVGSGKSTLCKVLLGEIPTVQGQVICGSKLRSIGFCDQTPFLPDATVRDIIVGCTEFEAGWYNKVVEATDLWPDINTFTSGDLTKIGPNGSTLSGGQRHRIAIARAIYARPSTLIFDDITSGLDGPTEDIIFQKVFGEGGLLRQLNSTVVFCTHSVKHLPSAHHIIALGVDGTIVEQGTFPELSSSASYVQSLNIEAVGTSVIASTERQKNTTEPLTVTAESKGKIDDRTRQIGDLSVYKTYLATAGVLTTIAFITSTAAFGFGSNFSTIWVEFWSAHNTAHPDDKSKQGYYLGLYGLIQFSSLAGIMGGVASVDLILASRSGRQFHLRAIQTVMAAPLSLFTATPPGVILNRFSQDLTILDGELSMSITNLSFTVAIAIGLAAVVATASPYVALCYPVLFALLYVLQFYYLRTSRQLRYLDLETKSPLFTHFLETLSGLPTLRAFGWMPSLVVINHHLMDSSQRAVYLLPIVQEALGTTLSWTIAALATVVVTLATQLRVGAGFAGASLFALMQFGMMLTAIIRSWTQLEVSIGAVSRLQSFSKTIKSEDLEGETNEPPEEWPQYGSIDIQNVSAAYTNNFEGEKCEKDDKETENLALREVSLCIQRGEKVGIVGRTGSGKSSLILLLLRLLDPVPTNDWKMTIDGISLDSIDRNTLRSRLIAMPQDTFFLPDGQSYMENLDPYHMSSQEDCRKALDSVGLWSLVEERGGLEEPMKAEYLSQGQKQLFSVSRAILRAKSRANKGATGGVLLLDEVTSSVDEATDAMIQKAIRKEFADYTIIAVAHRMETLRDFDRIIVMENGKIKDTFDPRIEQGVKHNIA